MFTITEKDNGIRPAGKPDECFYCNTKVGGVHGSECVMIVCMVEYDVLVIGQKVGTFTREDPAFWDEERCNFNKNDSSWCCDNALNEIKWLINDSAILAQKQITELRGEIDEYGAGECCTCDLLEFRFVKKTTEPFLSKG